MTIPKRHATPIVLAVCAAALLALLISTGCARVDSPMDAPEPQPASAEATPQPTPQSVEPTPVPADPDTAAPPGPSAASMAYARELGGVPQDGRELYFVIGASTESERQAQKRLDAATPLFGDMQSYFVVQRSDGFDGMRPGYWIVVEAYEEKPSSENLDFARRGFPDAYVKRATVRTTAPLPVYEQIVGN